MAGTAFVDQTFWLIKRFGLVPLLTGNNRSAPVPTGRFDKAQSKTDALPANF